jgi:hypothetical protein
MLYLVPLFYYYANCHFYESHFTECGYAHYSDTDVVMLCVILPSVVVLIFIMLSILHTSYFKHRFRNKLVHLPEHNTLFFLQNVLA